MIDAILTILSSEPTLTIIRIIGGIIGGIGTPILLYRWRNRVQTIECHYIESCELETIPIKNLELPKTLYSQIYIIKNTTRENFNHLEVEFKFHNLSHIQKCYRRFRNDSKEISNGCVGDNILQNKIDVFNQGDKVEYRFTITNIVDEHKCCVNILNIPGVKIKCIDKRKKQDRTNTFSRD